jgi:putative transposase
MKDNPYASHWVDAIIRTAYSIMENWRKRYLKGKAIKIKPRIKREVRQVQDNAYEDRLLS